MHAPHSPLSLGNEVPYTNGLMVPSIPIPMYKKLYTNGLTAPSIP